MLIKISCKFMIMSGSIHIKIGKWRFMLNLLKQMLAEILVDTNNIECILIKSE